MQQNIRVRYAPSPTGFIHIGNLRTALYNYLFARHNNGKLILRIEDTDQSRKVEKAVENIIDTLQWVGIEYDEGPFKEGDYAPYFQSQRLKIYYQYAKILIENKKAYYCFCSEERLNAIRQEQQLRKVPVAKYDKKCLSLTEQEISDNLNQKLPYVIRLNVEPGRTIKFNDFIRGEVQILSDLIDDQILIKSDGFPTYHLANVIDDYLMKITHIIRGEEWLPSTPKHILLYEAFGWELPVFAHLPLLLNKDRSKLSKRQGDVSVEDYKNKGYLPEALINFIALLGWNPKDEQEIFSMNELIEKFTLEAVHKSGAIFDIEKLNWLNGEYIRKKSNFELLILLREELSKSKYNNNDYSDEYLIKVINAMKPRITFIKEIYEKGYFFFEEPESFDKDLINKFSTTQYTEILNTYLKEIKNIQELTKEDLENLIKYIVDELKIKKANLIQPLRLAISASLEGPSITDIILTIGKEKTIQRINKFIEKLTE
ncbi:MAG: glutamate--tRNA ligase [Ignavibacteria bacterium]|nr:glutamate--tRNA ligase [Ignavibacteria bacterium]